MCVQPLNLQNKTIHSVNDSTSTIMFSLLSNNHKELNWCFREIGKWPSLDWCSQKLRRLAVWWAGERQDGCQRLGGSSAWFGVREVCDHSYLGQMEQHTMWLALQLCLWEMEAVVSVCYWWELYWNWSSIKTMNNKNKRFFYLFLGRFAGFYDEYLKPGITWICKSVPCSR